MSFVTAGHAKKSSGSYTTAYTVFAIRANNFGNDLATKNCLAVSSTKFLIMVFNSPLLNSQFPNPTNGYSFSYGLKLDKLLNVLCGFKDLDLTQSFPPTTFLRTILGYMGLPSILQKV